MKHLRFWQKTFLFQVFLGLRKVLGDCCYCTLNKIDSVIASYGGYMCVNEHLQCLHCIWKNNGHCRICYNIISFVEMSMDAPNQRMAKIQARIREVYPTPSNVSSSSTTSEHFISKTIFSNINSETLLSQEQERLRFHATEKSKAINDDVHNGGLVDNKLMNIPLNDKPDKSTGITCKTHSKNGQPSLLDNVIKESNVEAQASREHNIDASHHRLRNNTQYRPNRYRRHTISEYTPRQDYKLLFANVSNIAFGLRVCIKHSFVQGFRRF